MFIDLSREEADFVRRLVDAWEDGLDDAKRMTIEDHSIPDPELLLQLVDGYREDNEMIRSLRKKIAMSVAYGNTNSGENGTLF